MQPIRSFALTAACVAVLCAVTGCAGSKYGAQITRPNYYPECYRPIWELRQAEHKELKGTAIGAGLGALGGVLTCLFAADRKDRGKCMAVGGAVGAVGGGVIGNIYARNQRIADENRRMAQYLNDLEGEIGGLDIVSASAQASRQCYALEFMYLTKELMPKGRVSRGQAKQMATEIKNGLTETNTILGVAEDTGRQLDVAYWEALNQEERNLEPPPQNVPPDVAQQPETPRRTPGKVKKPSRPQPSPARDNLAKAKKKRRDLNRKVENIRKEREVAQADSRKVDELLAQIDA